MTRYSGKNQALLYLWDNWDSGDPYGSAMTGLGSCCDILWAFEAINGEEYGQAIGNLFWTVKYEPGMWDRESFLWELTRDAVAQDWGSEEEVGGDPVTASLMSGVMHGYITLDDLMEAAYVLHRIVNVARSQGVDY